ncbi:hypothetical protein MLD38_027733 [Melastoma candidum]|uniref:Uncharacterized protein n=1 Tax=Melastoma candidum TaxID=119954 RepID=A0ACB9P5A4_9MYRT|nr:hypothetical protein MLD38_027733 [Melastoma candidum]
MFLRMSKRKRYSDYVAWDEHIVCAERGRRVVHYHMKDGSGNSMLAIVGTERSIRHMLYVPTDELLWAFGTGGVINGNKQWRSRREVVALLASLVSSMSMSLLPSLIFALSCDV